MDGHSGDHQILNLEMIFKEPIRVFTNVEDLIKHFEKLELVAYKCPQGKLTIGWGHTDGVYEGMKITVEQAKKFLKDDIAIAKASLKRLIKVPLTEQQEIALISWVFNIGETKLKDCDLVKLINSGHCIDCALNLELLLWRNMTVKEGNVEIKKMLLGLFFRRACELATSRGKRTCSC